MSAEWQRHDLGDGPADGAIVAGSVNGRLLVVHGTAEFGIVAWRSAGDGFVSSDVVADMTAPTMAFGLAVYGGSVVIVASDVARFVPRVWASTDGAAWAETATSGLDQPADVGALTATPDTMYAAGAYRVGLDPAAPPSGPAIWRSTDGQHWEPLTPPNVGDRGFVSDIVAGPDSMIVAMGGAPAGSIWRSTDGGSTWTQAAVEVGSTTTFWTVESIARHGDRLVGVGTIQDDTGPRLLIVVSSDDGATWSRPPVSDTLSNVNGMVRNEVVAAAGAIWIATSQYNGPFDNPDTCYQDLRACQGGARPVLLRSTDGINWVEIDLTPVSTSWIERLAEDPTSGLALVGRIAGTSRLAVWTWPHHTPPPTRPPPVAPPADEPPLIHDGDQLTLGQAYRYPLYIHCGLGVLGEFNNQWWIVVDGSTEVDPELGPGNQPPPHWPIAEQAIFGMITLVDEDTINYSIPSGEIIARYQPATIDPQLCE